MPSEKVEFKGAFGDTLSAKIDWPDEGKLKSWVLFAHGFSIGKDLKPIRTISKSLVENGYGMLRFDFTGLGDSGGNFSDTNFTSNCEDIRMAANFLRDNHRAPCVMIAKVLLAGRPFVIKEQFLEDIGNQDIAKEIADLDRALMIFHSPQDRVVSIDNAGHIYSKAKHPKSFVSLDGADHLLLKNPADAEYVGEWTTFVKPFKKACFPNPKPYICNKLHKALQCHLHSSAPLLAAA